MEKIKVQVDKAVTAIEKVVAPETTKPADKPQAPKPKVIVSVGRRGQAPEQQPK